MVFRGETSQNGAGLCPAVADKKYLSQMRSASSLKGRFQCEKPVSVPFCRDFHKGRLRCAGQKKLLINCDLSHGKGKMWQVNAVNGSQMVVKTGVVYCRQVWDSAVGEVEMFMLIVLRTLSYSQNRLKRPAHQHVENQQSCCSYPFSNQKLYSLRQPISILSPTHVL